MVSARFFLGRGLGVAALALLTTAAACRPGAMGGLGAASCPALASGADPLSLQFSADARADAKIRTFVLAATELSRVSLEMEARTAGACQRIATDLGASPGELAAHGDGAGEAARAACAAAAGRVDWILRQGVRVGVRVTPPVCQASLQAKARCDGACAGSASGSAATGAGANAQADAECSASCNASATFNASCTPAQVEVTGAQGNDMVARLVTTLRANLPELVYAQVALAGRVARDARVVVEVGAQLPRVVGQAGVQALACVAAAASASVQASARIDVSFRASASVTGQVGAG